MYLIVYYAYVLARAQVLAWSHCWSPMYSPKKNAGYTVGWNPAWWLQEFFMFFLLCTIKDKACGSKHFKVVLNPWKHTSSTSQEGTWNHRDGTDHPGHSPQPQPLHSPRLAGSVGLRCCLKTPRLAAWENTWPWDAMGKWAICRWFMAIEHGPAWPWIPWLC